MLKNNKILNNYNIFDSFLANISHTNNFLYNSFLSIRLVYSASYGKEDISRKETVIDFLKVVYFLLKICITKSFLEIKDRDILIIGSNRVDNEISNILKIPNTSVVFSKKIFSFTKKDIDIYITFYRCLKLYKKYKILDFKILLKSLPSLIDFLIVNRDIELSNLKVLVMEGDAVPVNMALIFKAKENNIKTIKIDNFLIDPINHNRVFCDYYFYPSYYHLKIMKSFPSNDSVKYIEGGIVHWDNLVKYKKELNNNKREITFFSQHSEISKREINYIEEIISLMQENDYLNIKIHPLDKSNRFDIYLNNPKIKLYKDTIDNYQLISKSEICLSICSTLSLESKHICEKTYFINYFIEEFQGYIDYDIFNNFIYTIRSHSDLKEVLLNKNKIFPITEFIKNFNISFPNSSEKLKELIHTIY
ncbi:hypothetical protein [Aliarcobacter butzleri]|uniref:hypothetical protein n=1 Tax=Aliarcobacter butzleri TaxID=28197 RepID=UPI00244733A8|nr:hypothetical protein [Aliarcobacter butzleri]MDH1977191.1 hypothetical protein [Aliarcobacter butzleri]